MFTAVSKVLKLTEDSSSEIKSFIDEPGGEKISVIVRNFCKSFFGTTPMGDVLKFCNGGVRKGQ